MLLFKGSFVHVESSFDNPAKKLSGKTTGFSGQSPRKTKNQFFMSIFWRFSLCTLDYCFDTPEHFFIKIRENFPQIPKKVDDSINYFYHFFLKVLLRTRERHF